ncbi:hypothetical protein GF343_01835 [Candidatus Woesearchaeota archaeon]|nr:hypothetical protein [Candidatus Woesearchaeota archaeon]
MQYKLPEREEDRLIKIVNTIWSPILLSFAASNAGIKAYIDTLEECIEAGNASAEEAAEITGKDPIHESMNGYSMYRNYAELREKPAVAVMIADTLLKAENHGYRWKIIKTAEEVKAAKQDIGGYESYAKYIAHVSTQQRFAAMAFEKKVGDARLLKSSTMSTKPVIELEKDRTKQHLIFMESTAGNEKREAYVMAFSDKRHEVFNQDFYFHEEQWAERAEKQFE